MARVADLLEAVVVGRRLAQRRVGKPVRRVPVRRDVVDQNEETARLQHPIRLGDETVHMAEMMGRDAAGDEVEAGRVERQRLGVRRLAGDVLEPALASEPGGDLEHLRRDVGGHHPRHMGREGQRRVPGARGDVERLPMGLRLGQLHHARQAGALGVDRADGVALCAAPELGLDEGLVHGCAL